MNVKKILSLAASTIKLFIIIIFLSYNSKAEEQNIKSYSDDKGILALMYHRFDENKYPSTNIQMDVFKQQIKIINTFEYFFNKNLSDSYDLVYIDGNHNKKNTLQYFEYLLNRINNDSLLIFNHIYWDVDMTEAWNQIKEHPKVTVSIDTFYWGIVKTL